jgi:hypothetical protein
MDISTLEWWLSAVIWPRVVTVGMNTHSDTPLLHISVFTYSFMGMQAYTHRHIQVLIKVFMHKHNSYSNAHFYSVTHAHMGVILYFN